MAGGGREKVMGAAVGEPLISPFLASGAPSQPWLLTCWGGRGLLQKVSLLVQQRGEVLGIGSQQLARPLQEVGGAAQKKPKTQMSITQVALTAPLPCPRVGLTCRFWGRSCAGNEPEPPAPSRTCGGWTSALCPEEGYCMRRGRALRLMASGGAGYSSGWSANFPLTAPTYHH